MITIAIPSNRGFKTKTVQSLVEMITYSKHEYQFVFPTEGFNTAESRNLSVAKAIQSGSEYILFSDDDMIYPPDTLERLLAHGKDIIGTLYNIRRLPPAFVIEYLDAREDQWARTQTEPFRCKAIGTGMLLMLG